MKYIRIIGLAIVISLMGYERFSFAQEKGFLYFKVKLNVEAEPENIKGSIESYMGRELESLGDVILTDIKPEWEINVMATEITTDNSDNKIIACTAVIFETLNMKKLDSLIDTYLSKLRGIDSSAIDKFYTEIAKLVNEYKRMSEHLFFLADTIHIRRLCSEVIANFDEKCLRQKREFYKLEQEAIRKLY